MIIIGLTGVIGSGKSTVARLLRNRGFYIIDIDALGKESLTWKETQEDIKQIFGDGAVTDGKVNLGKLSDIVFRQRDALRVLESIVHPRVRVEVLKQIEEQRASGARAVIIDHPLLFETDAFQLADKVVVVAADQEKTLERLKQRGITPDEARRRLSFQIPLSEKELRADYVVDNNGTEEQLENRIDSLLEMIRKWEVNGHASQ
jgi:dephospho-CoA kinase